MQTRLTAKRKHEIMSGCKLALYHAIWFDPKRPGSLDATELDSVVTLLHMFDAQYADSCTLQSNNEQNLSQELIDLILLVRQTLSTVAVIKARRANEFGVSIVGG